MVSFAFDGKVEVLLSVRGSAVVLVTVAVFVVAPDALSVSSKTALMLFPSTPGKLAIVQEMLPLPPTRSAVPSAIRTKPHSSSHLCRRMASRKVTTR